MASSLGDRGCGFQSNKRTCQFVFSTQLDAGPTSIPNRRNRSQPAYRLELVASYREFTAPRRDECSRPPQRPKKCSYPCMCRLSSPRQCILLSNSSKVMGEKRYGDASTTLRLQPYVRTFQIMQRLYIFAMGIRRTTARDNVDPNARPIRSC